MSTRASQPVTDVAIHPETRMGIVRLRVRDLDRSRAFYEQALGLVATAGGDGTVSVGPSGGSPLVELLGDATAPPLDRRAPGLYHLAVLVPSRVDLAFALGRLVAIPWPLDGASDHLVSEALYLSDPDGNGIEIYRDRPREQWPRADGRLTMDTLPLDLDHLLSELGGVQALQERAPAATTIGHVHLQVTDLGESEAFYSGILGFEVTVRGYPGVLFVAAGGYHHHLGLNAWNSAGSGPPAAGAVGLHSFEIVLPQPSELDRLRARLEEAGIVTSGGNGRTVARDPSGNQVVLRAV
jgi:catechol 2,3-dioxygenase